MAENECLYICADDSHGTPIMLKAKELGIDHKYILDRLKCLADNSEDDNIILQSTKELGKIIGTSVNSVKQRDVGVIGMFQGFSPEQIESVKPKKIANANIED